MPISKPDENYALFDLGVSKDFGGVTGYIIGNASAGKSNGDFWAVTVGFRAADLALRAISSRQRGTQGAARQGWPLFSRMRRDRLARQADCRGLRPARLNAKS